MKNSISSPLMGEDKGEGDNYENLKARRQKCLGHSAFATQYTPKKDISGHKSGLYTKLIKQYW